MSRRRSGRGPARDSARGSARKSEPQLPRYLTALGVTPRKALGQHFLIDEFILGDIVSACGLSPGDTVLEIGAGPGGLTEELLGTGASVVAVELDEELAALTRQRLADRDGLSVVAADVLSHTPGDLLAEGGAQAPYVAAGNLPYYITQPVVRRLLEAETAPHRIVVLVQREVARRMVGAGGRESMLSMSIKCYGDPEYLFDVPDTAFWPRPKVQSAVVRIDRLAEPAIDVPVAERPRFFQLLRAGYAEPRKQLHNALERSLALPGAECVRLLGIAEIDPTARAQHLDLAAWERLFLAMLDHHPRVLDLGLEVPDAPGSAGAADLDGDDLAGDDLADDDLDEDDDWPELPAGVEL